MNTEYTFSDGGHALLSVAEGLTLSDVAPLSWEAGAAGWSCAHTSGEPLCFLPPRVLLKSFSLCFSILWLSLSPLPPRALPGGCFASA